MRDIFYFDAAAELVVVLLLFSMFVKKIYKTQSSKIFIGILICCFIAALCEIPTCYPEKIGSDLMWVCNTGYFLARNTMPVAFIIYLFAITDSWSTVRKSSLLMTLTIVPYVIALILILSNFSTHAIFEILPDGTYTRGNLLWILYVISAIYLAYSTTFLVICRKFFGRYQFVALFTVTPMSVIAIIIQFFNPGYYVELFVSALSFIMICSAIETADQIMDSKTGLMSFSKFMSTTEKAYILKKDQYVVLLKIKNYSEIYNKLNYENTKKYVHYMCSEFDRRYRDIDSKYKTYSLDEGVYAGIFSSYDSALRVGDRIRNDFSELLRIKIDFRPQVFLCVTNVTKDFENISLFNAFLSNIHTKFDSVNEIIEMSRMKNDKRFIIENNIENIIDDGLKNNEFEVYYQPIFDTKRKKFTSAEALVRLNSTKYGFIVPDLFIKYAEKNGRITQIDNYVLEEVLKFISSDEFKDLGLEYIEVNLSFVDCSDPTLHQRVKGLLEKYNVSPELINLEFTESMDADYEIVDTNIEKLREIGIHFSLDDYGTGYSNIDRFSKLPLKLVKIDKSLVDRFEEEDMSCVIKNTINMIKDLNREIVVEGTETLSQAERFIQYGCDHIQGFYYSKPLAKEGFVKFLVENNNAKPVS
ncbi:MAG: EAL domain-containing protein [Acholeplasmatales bacterium]|nr:EAL domain-containing protein [Acholeplasmatales bacterium]